MFKLSALISKGFFSRPKLFNTKTSYWGSAIYANSQYISTAGSSVRQEVGILNNCKPRFGERKICVDGIDLNVLEEGEGSHNVLCLPGLVGTIKTDFGPIFKSMDKSKFRLVSWDPPGYGKSRPFNRNHYPDFYQDDAKLVARLMEILGYKEYSVLGWSNGGMTAYTLENLFPQRVTHLVLWGTHAYFDKQVFKQGYLLSDTKNWAPRTLKIMQGVYGIDYLEATLADWGNFLRTSYDRGENVMLEQRSTKIQCPTLILHGLMDPVLPIKHLEFYAKNIRDCKFHLFQKGKHEVHLTHTPEFVKEVEKFLLSSREDLTV